MASFDDVRLPEDVEIGAEGGPSFSTGIVTMANGQEQRTQNWSVARNTYVVGYGISETDWQPVRAFFYARRGRARGFRFKDWTDFVATEQPVQGEGPYTLARFYVDPIGLTYIRQITRVVAGTLTLTDQNGVDFTAYYTESFGLLTAKTDNPPPVHGQLFASFEFDIPVRFDVDELKLTAETISAVVADSISIVELIENSYKLNGL